MHARLSGPNSLLILEPDFPYLADEIAEPRPDMNIKVAAFTVSEKSINTNNQSWTFTRVCTVSAKILMLCFNRSFN